LKRQKFSLFVFLNNQIFFFLQLKGAIVEEYLDFKRLFKTPSRKLDGVLSVYKRGTATCPSSYGKALPHAHQGNETNYPQNEKNAIFSVLYSGRMAFFMDRSLSEELHLFSQELQRYLSFQALQKLAKEVGFGRRTSKYLTFAP
jgi:hypothetical protein